MKEAETTVNMIWEIEGIIAKLLMLTFAYHSTSYYFVFLGFVHTVRPTMARIPRIYMCFFKKNNKIYVGPLIQPEHYRRIVFLPRKRTNGSIIIDSLTRRDIYNIT
jgi:hypothetical protein